MAIFTSRRSDTQGSNSNDVKPHGSQKFPVMDVQQNGPGCVQGIRYRIAVHLEAV